MANLSSGPSVLDHHRTLLDLANRIEAMVSASATRDPRAGRKAVRMLLAEFVRELEAHLLAEGAALETDFSDNPELKAALTELEAEHPGILESFREAQKGLLGATTWMVAIENLSAALAKFRSHEAREDDLFRIE